MDSGELRGAGKQYSSLIRTLSTEICKIRSCNITIIRLPWQLPMPVANYIYLSCTFLLFMCSLARKCSVDHLLSFCIAVTQPEKQTIALDTNIIQFLAFAKLAHEDSSTPKRKCYRGKSTLNYYNSSCTV